MDEFNLQKKQFGSETLGSETINFLMTWANVTEEKRTNDEFLRQRLAIAVQNGNFASMRETLICLLRCILVFIFAFHFMYV